MKHIPADKYNIAWFKLAEFVTRKEKERALGIFRLLSHSLPSTALSAQLEGDILLAFQDSRALECYTKAAQLYQENNQLAQAAAVLEHIAAITNNYKQYAPLLITLYQELENQPKIVQYTVCYIEELLLINPDQADQFSQEIRKKLDKQHTIALCESLALLYCTKVPNCDEKIKWYIESVLTAMPNNSYQLHRFLTQLQHCNSTYYQYALNHLTL